MSAKPTRQVEALDLAVDTRRGALAPEDRRVFEQALSASAALRTAFEIGCDFDLASRIRAGDEALIARAAALAIARSSERRPRRLRWAGMLFAASLIIASAAAATRAVLNRRDAARASLATSAAESTHAKARALAARTGPVATSTVSAASTEPAAKEPTESSTPAATTAPVPLRASPHVEREPTPPSTVPVLAAEDTPQSLLARASAARRKSGLGAARALYLELQTRFPGSNEARVSYVSLGKLLLSAGRAGEADAAFAGYLNRAGGELREEALVGRADALFALGRTQEESRVRQELIRLYPSSVYASRARERLAQIERTQNAVTP